MNYDIKDYDGSLIHKRFGYELFKDEYNPLGIITAFRGNMDVTDNLIDLEDKLNNDFIYSDDALNFCWEIPNVCPMGAVFFQRLFAQNIGELLGSGYFGPFEVMVEGDDIMMRRPGDENLGKASVSITKVVDGNVALGHLAVNINAGSKAPSFAFSLNLKDEQVDNLAKIVKDTFYDTLQSCFIATTKVII
jgi:hypothetical protein